MTNKKLEEYSDQELLLELFTRNGGPQPGPTNIKLYTPHLIKDVAIDQDHTATILMPDEDFEILKGNMPQEGNSRSLEAISQMSYED